jgi:orotidine-5'-phosphate decarboxylase
MFPQHLAAAILAKGNPVVVGLDPRWDSLPAALRGSTSFGDWSGMAAAYEKFCRAVIDVVAPLVPIVKPQAAFFEELGPFGMIALENVLRYARERGLVLILDGKRNDIGSTATAYANAYLTGGASRAWTANALTVSPYLGEDSLTPFLQVAEQTQSGIFVLVKTSNPGGGMFQDLMIAGRPLYRHVAAWVETQAARTAADTGYGICGAVVGATYPEQLADLRAAMPHAWLLIPGYGSQGGTAADVAPGFAPDGLGAVVNNSRGIREIFIGSTHTFSARR